MAPEERGMEHLQPGEAREFMEARDVADYTLLDVRQVWEFDESHIPGALNLPLPELADRMVEIDRRHPVLVYCRSGGRSQAAAGMLDSQGFERVYNVLGGITAWDGPAAEGPVDLGMRYCTGLERPGELVLLAFGMEIRLQEFYRRRAAEAADAEARAVFERLVGFEDRHKAALFDLYNRLGPDAARPVATLDAMAALAGEPVYEGGLAPEAFQERYGDMAATTQGAVELAMMLEAQAHDYYVRCAAHVAGEEARKVVLTLAQEEKAHLRVLGHFMDTKPE